MKTKINQSMHLRNLSVLAAFTALNPTAQSAIVFSSDFDSVIPAEITAGTALITPVQGYSGLGPSGNIFAGSFLRSQTANVVTLKLTGLPAMIRLAYRYFSRLSTLWTAPGTSHKVISSKSPWIM